MGAENSICSKRASLAQGDPIVTKSASEPIFHAGSHVLGPSEKKTRF
jgi:hypothetical protein